MEKGLEALSSSSVLWSPPSPGQAFPGFGELTPLQGNLFTGTCLDARDFFSTEQGGLPVTSPL